ncbi:hypothetical protein LSCM1_02909 [Leishmania martiniquensis]|uniref:RESC1/2 CYTH-like domain-containing protein n=1 Tax=Leishmania martiniquensis TaxID=1580590 RepID=A0A836HLL9_9TRYP|nr:hypothetical protein LSCM1_02909 [Leishmania martiniquensis]
MLRSHRRALLLLLRSSCEGPSWQSAHFRGTCSRTVTAAALCVSRRYESSAGPTTGDCRASGPHVALSNKMVKVKYEEVWQLWNEGNLFSLQVAQMRDFLADVGITVDPTAKKAAVVRRMEEYLHKKDSAEQRGSASAAAGAAEGAGRENEQGYGNWAGAGTTQPEPLLDLAQAGFYKGTANMVPKAFQLLTTGSCAEAVVRRVNTSTFPGFPANTECYTLSSSDAAGALQTRYSKVLQWCLLNMSNLRMDGELTVEIGKLLLTPAAMRYSEAVVSAYTLQQRLQLTKPYTWVSTAPESAVPLVEAFLQERGFQPVSKNARLTYEGGIKRAKDKLEVVLNEHMKVEGVYGEWVDVQTAFCTSVERPDCRILLRSRPAVSAQDCETYARIPIIELADDDVSDVLPPENGQLVYLSENETRHFERLNERGIAIAVRETRRQPLIVLRDEEEDPRLEYQISVTIPASAGSHSMDVRAVGLEVLTLSDELSTLLKEPFNEAYRCVPALAAGSAAAAA